MNTNPLISREQPLKKRASSVNQDIYEATLALVGNESMRKAGIDQAFAANLARNIVHFDNLGERSRQRIKDEFLSMSYELSYLDNVARKHSEEKVQALATWLKNVNLLLAMSRFETRPPRAPE